MEVQQPESKLERDYDPSQPTTARREKVVLPDGRVLWVHGMSTAQFVAMKARAARAPGDPRGGEDQSAMILLQFVMCCYNSKGERLFSDLDLDKAGQFTFEEYLLIMGAINRVNGLDAEETELLRDFTVLTREPSFST